MTKMQYLVYVLVVSAACVFGQNDRGDSQPVLPPKIRYLHIESNIAYRFATTNVASMLANSDTTSREAVFTIQLPKSAFITTFAMTIEGVTYNGDVKEKEQARREYIEAKRQGQSAGHIAAKPRNTNAFEVSVNVAPQQKVTFNLTYQELLQRALAMYQNVIYINPGQIVNDMKVDVYINESRPITVLRVPALQKDVQDSLNSFEVNPDAVVSKTSPKSAHISFHPSIALQKEMSDKGISGQFIVQYDVQRGYDAGDIQVVDGYFVHFIAPAGLPAVRKNVLFILDISGSMHGKKIQQVKEAMKVILGDLKSGDLFNIFLFDDMIMRWNQSCLVPVNADTIRLAEAYVANMNTRGSTDINLALTEGISFLDDQIKQENPMNPSSLIVFLTDGDPTSGETNIDSILSNVRDANEDSGYSIFSLGFGFGVDFNFLRKISLQNNGIARKIYEDSDAAIQLQGFYKEISTPLLTNLEVEYLDVENTTSITRNEFPIYFNGSEIVICGPFDPPDLDDSTIFRTRVRGRSNGNDVIMEKELDVLDPSNTGLRVSTERLWAYLTIKELLDKMEKTTNDTIKADIKERALQLSLKYSFVTPLTSMIVKKPNQTESSSELADSDEQARGERGRYMQPAGLSPSGKQRQSYSGPVGQSGRAGPVGVSGPAPPVPVGLSGGIKGTADYYDSFDDDDLATRPPAFSIIGSYVMLTGIDDPRIRIKDWSMNYCHDPLVPEGDQLLLHAVDMSDALVFGHFTDVEDTSVLTSVRMVMPYFNLSVEIDVNEININCHGVPETRTWVDLNGTHEDLIMPGMVMPGMSRRNQGRRRWARMESHQLRVYLTRNLVVLVTVNFDDQLPTYFLSLKFEVTGHPKPGTRGMIGGYLSGTLLQNGDFEVRRDDGSVAETLGFSNPITQFDFYNRFSLADDECDII